MGWQSISGIHRQSTDQRSATSDENAIFRDSPIGLERYRVDNEARARALFEEIRGKIWSIEEGFDADGKDREGAVLAAIKALLDYVTNEPLERFAYFAEERVAVHTRYARLAEERQTSEADTYAKFKVKRLASQAAWSGIASAIRGRKSGNNAP